jgi:GT2 family glycosyltransferase
VEAILKQVDKAGESRQSGWPVFILHWNQPDECLRTVKAIRDQNAEVCARVVDNASKPDKFDYLKKRLPEGTPVIAMPENKGWGSAFNIVLRRWLETETSEFCFISAHDALPDDGCLRLLIQAMEADSRIGIACPEYGVPEVPRFSQLRYVRIAPVEPRPGGTVEPVDIPNGTLMVFRRKCLEEIGLFDERYFAYGDEHEIGLRAWRNGWKVAIVWGAVVVNPDTYTQSSIRSYLFTRNSLLLVKTHAGRWAAALRLLLMIPNTLRIWLMPPDGYAFSLRARLAGMQDFLAGRYGPPPELNS